jgi:hypothetical protein
MDLVRSKVIIRSGINIPPEKQINEAIAELGHKWRVVKAETVLSVFGVEPTSNTMSTIPRCVYVTTVVMEEA